MEDPSRKYKFTSIEFNLSTDLKITSRATYSLLDYFGDMGGLIDAFRIIGSLLLTPVVTFAMKARLMSNIFRFRESHLATTIS